MSLNFEIHMVDRHKFHLQVMMMLLILLISHPISQSIFRNFTVENAHSMMIVAHRKVDANVINNWKSTIFTKNKWGHPPPRPKIARPMMVSITIT